MALTSADGDGVVFGRESDDLSNAFDPDVFDWSFVRIRIDLCLSFIFELLAVL